MVVADVGKTARHTIGVRSPLTVTGLPHVAAADLDGGRVVPEYPAGNAGKTAGPVPGVRRRELLAGHGVPALPV
jgi:hypothetical protein